MYLLEQTLPTKEPIHIRIYRKRHDSRHFYIKLSAQPTVIHEEEDLREFDIAQHLVYNIHIPASVLNENIRITKINEAEANKIDRHVDFDGYNFYKLNRPVYRIIRKRMIVL